MGYWDAFGQTSRAGGVDQECEVCFWGDRDGGLGIGTGYKQGGVVLELGVGSLRS